MAASQDQQRRPVIVIGAGPAGLSSALGLRALGVPVCLLEAEPEDRVRPGSRALYVHRDSLRLLERMRSGVGTVIADRGIRWHGRRTFYRGRLVFARDHPETSGAAGRWPPPYASLRQVETEGFLLAACRAAGVELVWSARVDEVRSGSAGIELCTADGRAWTSGYLIAADGARSCVRARIGRTMQGDRSNSYHVVVDLADDPASPAAARLRTFHYHHPGLDGRHVLVVPFAGGRQVDLQCHRDEDPDELLTETRLRAWLPKVVEPGYLDRVLWVSRYPFLQLVADSFVDENRRVLLVGEAAHLYAPFGARGMNSGIADAAAASGAVAAALTADSPDRAWHAVDRYNTTRRSAAENNRDAAGRALAHMRPRGMVPRVRQRAAAALTPVVPRFGEWLEKAPYGPRIAASATGTY
ncbi:MAG: FAD-dependent monooxygenase [Pseudonocardiaceae bacterium]